MLTRLGDLLHAVLRRDATPEHPVRDEIDLARAYVALEQLRFGDRLEVTRGSLSACIAATSSTSAALSA